jgi:hypothetical protein
MGRWCMHLGMICFCCWALGAGSPPPYSWWRMTATLVVVRLVVLFLRFLSSAMGV